jgi:hypothetical protein
VNFDLSLIGEKSRSLLWQYSRQYALLPGKYSDDSEIFSAKEEFYMETAGKIIREEKGKVDMANTDAD